MVERQSHRQINITNEANDALREIWRWNAKYYNPGHADRYLQFLNTAIDSLADPTTLGKPVPGRANLRYLLIRRKSSGNGHLAVYEVLGNQITVLRIYHTSQDWQTTLSGDDSSN